MSRRTILSCTILAAVFSVMFHVAINSPISPLPLSSLTSTFKQNNILQRVEKLGEGKLHEPEDICVGKDGKLYTGTRDGWIKRMHLNGTWEDWKFIGGSSILGLDTSKDGDIIACDGNQGLLKVGEDGFTVLVKDVDGKKILFPNDVNEASDGNIYFSDSSTKYGFPDRFMDLLENGTNGRLLKYDPVAKTASVILPNISFANGVALSPDEDYLLLAETLRFRCHKYWLRGDKKGTAEIFIDNLPGIPDNIKLAPDGSFWIALVEPKSWWLELVQPFPLVKQFIAALPKAVREEISSRMMEKRARVINVDAGGKIVTQFDDSDGSVISFVSSALELEGDLYLGSLQMDFVGKLHLDGQE